MASEIYIPPATKEKLNGAHSKGTRHAEMKDCAISLIGNGMAPEAVFAQIRASWPDPDKSDKEIHDLVAYAVSINPSPSGFGDAPAAPRQQYKAPKTPPKPKLDPLSAIKRYMGDSRCSVEQFMRLSPVPIPADLNEQGQLAISQLYSASERVNVVCAHFIGEDGKPKPYGPGKSLLRDEWLEWISEKGVPSKECGCWLRPNPCAEKGTGKDGAVEDENILAWRFTFIESDILDLETQLAFYARLKLPISAVILSGGDSAHAWVRVDAVSWETYKSVVARIFGLIERFGFDKSNKNCSRLSRMPGAVRKLGAKGSGHQRLVFLNPNPKLELVSEESLNKLELLLQTEATEAAPLKKLAEDSIVRWIELQENRGNLGLPTGNHKFDQITGGLKPKQMTVVAAESNGGKSSVVLNVCRVAAVEKAKGVALFSLEMDREEIFDILTSMIAKVDRNKFNTGRFDPEDQHRMAEAARKKLSLSPLWIFDDPNQTLQDVRQKCLRLKAERNLSLIAVDYLQLLIPEDGKSSREQEVSAITRGLRILAVECNVPLIALSQVNDDGKLRESRTVGHAAHAVWLIEQEQEDDPFQPREMHIRVTKGRGIPKRDYPMMFDPIYSLLTNISESTSEEEQYHRGSKP